MLSLESWSYLYCSSIAGSSGDAGLVVCVLVVSTVIPLPMIGIVVQVINVVLMVWMVLVVSFIGGGVLVILLCRIVLTVFLVVGILIYPRCHGTRSLCCLVTTWPNLFANNIEQKTQYQQRGQVYPLVVLEPPAD